MYDDGSVQDRTTMTRWSSANEKVATINAEGTLTAIGEGQTIVTAVFDNMSAAKTIRVDLP
jgi:Big-like domain-containing protein